MRTTIVLTMSVMIAVVSASNVTLAQTGAEFMEKRALGFVEMVQRGDLDDLLAYMHTHWASDKKGSDRSTRWPRIAAQLIEHHRTCQIVGVTADEPYILTVVTEEKDGPTVRFIFEFETEPPHRILAMGIEAGDRPPGPELPPLTLDADADSGQIVEALNQWFDHLADDDIFSGTALVAWQGRAIFRGAWGMASLRWKIPNSIDTRFDLGSINKSFTKIAIGQLLIEGKLSLDDPVSAHLPNYPNQEVADKVTVRHLLEHSSGLGDIFTEEFFNSSKSLYRAPGDFFELFADQPLQFQPGEKRAYSNAGFMVLGAIIEAASGVPYDEYVQRHIFEPAGMTNSGFFAGDEPVENLAEGYTLMSDDPDNTERRSNVYILPAKGNSAGSAQSTVDDLLAFDNAIREYRLLPANYTEWYFSEGDPPESASNNLPQRATAGIGIAGGAPGVSAALESNGDLAVIVLSNYDAPISETVARSLFRPLMKALSSGR